MDAGTGSSQSRAKIDTAFNPLEFPQTDRIFSYSNNFYGGGGMRFLLFGWLSCALAMGAVRNEMLKSNLQGEWQLNAMTCSGVSQKLEMDYRLSFEGAKGAYVSKTKDCTQVEPELYQYLPHSKLSIKQGIRSCQPNPCGADLSAADCGKETNPVAALYDVRFKEYNKTMVLSTSDPKSVDCIGPGQKKPAVFIFTRKAIEGPTR